MAIKSIIEFPVEDEAFKRFVTLFEDFQEKIKELPGEWRRVDDAMTGAGKNFAKASGDTDAILTGMAASSATIVEAIHHATKAQRQFEHATKRSHSALHGVEQTAKKLSSTVFGLGKWMLKFGTIGGGLAGIAGGIGLDDLANSAVSRQRSARGVGMTPGQEAAFNTYFGQFGNSQGVESGVAEARTNVEKRYALSAIGISESDLANKSNFALSIEAERRAQQIVKSAPRDAMMNVARARGLFDLGFTPDQLRVLRNTSSQRLDQAAQGASRSTHALGFTPAVARDWAQFSIALRRAGGEIESSLITGLDRLTPELTRISREVSDWISAFVKGGDFQKWIGDFETGIKEVAEFLSSKKFHKDMEIFGQDIVALGRAAHHALQFFGLIPGAKASKATNPKDVGAYGFALGDETYPPKAAAHNPGNIRHRTAGGKWELNGYRTEGAGMRAMAALLQSYPSKHHADTIASIIPIYNGHGKNDPEYIKRVSEWSGYKPNQKLDLNNNLVRDKIMAAMIREEHSTKITPVQVQAELQNSDQRQQKQTNALLKKLATQGLIRPSLTIRNQTSARVALQANGAAY